MRAPKKLTQILPTVLFMPKLVVDDDLEAQLIDIATRAMVRGGKVMTDADEFGGEPPASLFASEWALEAAELYVSAKKNETKLPDFRKMVDRESKGSIAAAVDHLLKLLRDDNDPPFAQMRVLFCFEDRAVGQSPYVNGEPKESQEESDDPAYDGNAGNPEQIWRTQYSPEVIKALLIEWQALMEELHQRAGGKSSAPGPTPIDAEIHFVSWLAHFWTKELRLTLSSGRGNPTGVNPHGQQGPFAEFVRKAAEIIPPGMRPHSLDRAIRINIQAGKRSGTKPRSI